MKVFLVIALSTIALNTFAKERKVAQSTDSVLGIAILNVDNAIVIDGAPAKSLFRKLDGKGTSSVGDSGEHFTVKNGKNYSCTLFTDNDTCNCVIPVKNVKTGEM